MIKLLLLPVVMIWGIMKILLEGVTKVYCLVAGIVINILVICSVLAVITRQWFTLGVIAMLFIIIISVILCYGTIMNMLLRFGEDLLKFAKK